jgi:predicted adenine nucleotide alpha hydrolase (AANH) superfamily ATPase
MEKDCSAVLNMNSVMGREQNDAEMFGLSLEQRKPSILLHACCGPCSTSCVERLAPDYQITVYYYNPNITDREEYYLRRDTLLQFIRAFNEEHTDSYFVSYLEGEHDPGRYIAKCGPLADEPEGGRRCLACFALRLGETDRQAKAHGFDYFTTTLSVSPHKNAENLHRAGQEAARAFGVRYLPADFKKRNGYLRSLRLSAEYSLYRQDYCGCLYSKNPENHGRSDDTEGRS